MPLASLIINKVGQYAATYLPGYADIRGGSTGYNQHVIYHMSYHYTKIVVVRPSVRDQWEVAGNWAGPGLKHAISLCYYSWMLYQGVYKHS